MKQPIPYYPRYRVQPKRLLNVPSAWTGIETILDCLLKDFHVENRVAIEFGVEHGYSLAALSNYFALVIGVDTFSGLGHEAETFYPVVQNNLSSFHGVVLLRMSFQNFILAEAGPVMGRNPHGADLIHIDVEHSYADTYTAGEWAVQHAPVTLFHDTLSYIDIPNSAGIKACGDLAEKYDLHYYNFEESHGLGILSRRAL